ncbi:alanine racemase [[Clostridium] polysaccharolyticum]|uniref:Alanine racemase n=1 Tax=[Clostridium] polysaccharolyticum TaxID=29364 RepID=A0A1I0EHG1_9FIRM|nr:alanine racemase [[Clostridium] polysaccharolyticum]SET44685.1 alanine racemase [[Clostridium] polysaccharolyticum]
MDYYRVHADVNLDAIYKNIEETKKLLSNDTKLMVIIKADGYGHGAIPVAKVLDPIVDAYGIAIIEEGIELRENGIAKPLLILGVTPVPLYSQLVEYDIMPAIFSYETAEKLAEEARKQNKTAKIHIAADTGMSRIGFPVNEESIKTVQKIAKLDGISIEGCFSHFAAADEKDKTFTLQQINRFQSFVDELEANGVHIPVKHLSNSAGIMEVPNAHYDMVRSGISTYGLYPSEEVDKSALRLCPAMEIKSFVTYVKTLDAGIGISYGQTFVTREKTRVATVPVGYADGYPRALSNQGYVLIHGKKAAILGRVCMDQFMVDVTDIPGVSEGDIVTLVGKDGDECITVEELAAMSHSFNYEFVCDIGKRVPRVYYYRGEKAGTYDFYHCSQDTYNISF